MSAWVGIIFDGILIVVVSVGILQAMRLIAQLRDLKASRADMDRFVRDFNGAVMRAEAGIKSLRAAARDSGDDLEKLVEKAVMVRDELNFIVDSADNLAERLSTSATKAMRGDHETQASAQPKVKSSTVAVEPVLPTKAEAPPSSRAEKDLLQALQKMK